MNSEPIYLHQPGHGLAVSFDHGATIDTVIPPTGAIAILYQRSAEDASQGVLQAHGDYDTVLAAYRKMWPALTRSALVGVTRGTADFVLESFPVSDLDETMVENINETLNGRASPATLRTRLNIVGSAD